MGTKNNLEIERKFLLKRIPNFDKEVSKFYMHQIYVNIDGVMTRFRMTEKLGLKVDENRTYVQCNKKRISSGVFEEIEKDIAKEVFRDMCHKEHSYIIKIRHVYEHDGLKWEVDEYADVSLVTLEVELDDIKQKITIPKIIKKELLMEVTGKKVFSNQNLSIKNEVVI